jgi:hypothetical protein
MVITIIDKDDVVERELAPLRACIGEDFDGYRNHVYRVLTYAMHFLDGEPRWREPIAFALAYHDVGLWTDRALAYLEPSERHAEDARATSAFDLNPTLIRDLIHWHHKVTPFRGDNARVVNAVRKADWIDASGGRLLKGLSRRQVVEVMTAIPPLGFYETLTRLPGELNHGRTLGGLAHMLAHVFKA